MKFLLNTTPWKNSCGLAALSHVLTQNILTQSRLNPLNVQARNRILNAFSTIYQVTDLHWQQLKKLLKLYQHPEDQQRLWFGPLRLILSQRLLSHEDYRNTLFHTFVAGLRHYVLEEQPTITDEYANIYQANQAFFEFARASYWRVREVRRIDKERDIFQENTLQAYWQQIGYVQYCHQHKQVIHNALMLTAEEMSHLCDALEIEFYIYENANDNLPSFSPINHTCKGFEGEGSLDILDAICSNHHWQPLTDSMSEAFRQQLLWKNGHRQLCNHSYEALRQAGRAGLLSDVRRFTAPLLSKAMQLGSYNQVAKISQSQADKRDPDNGFYNCIDEAISQKDLAMLLTIYYFKPNTRNYILNKSLRIYRSAFVADFLRYYQLLPKNVTDTKNWYKEIEKLLACIDKIDGDNDLHLAIRKGDTVEAKKLITKEEDIYDENDYQVSPLHLVCEKENVELLQAMCAIAIAENKAKGFWNDFHHFGLNLYHSDASGKTPLHYAANGKDPEFARVLLSRRDKKVTRPISLNVADETGKTPVHIAAVNDNQRLLQSFLTIPYLNGAQNAQDQLGLTPLHYAAATKNATNVQLLLQAGAKCDVNAYADKVKTLFAQLNPQLTYLTPLWISLELNDLETAKLLITDAQHLTQTINSQGFNAVQMAARQGRVELLRFWSERYFSQWGFGVADGKTLIHHAAETDQLEVIQFLETKGMWLSRLDNHSNSALHLAAQHGQLRVVEYLCDKSVTDNHYNESLKNKNALTHFFSKKRDVIELDARNADGETPYALALIYGHADIANRLRHAGASAVSLSNYLLGTIYQVPNQVMQERIATIAAHRHAIGLEMDANRNTFIHHAIKRLNYRALRILIHPLTIEQRKAVCLMKNNNGLKPLDLVTKLRRKKQLSKMQHTELDKIERALIGYHQPSYERKYPTVAQKARYHKDCANDLKQEMMQSSGYYYGSMGAMIVPPLFDALQVTTNPWSLMETAVTAYFGKNPLDVAERSASLLAQHYPESTPLYYADWFFWWMGWYRHTTRNIAGEIAKFGSSIALSQAKLDEYQFSSKNYFTYLNILGGLHAMAETKGKKFADEYLTQYCASIEQIFTENISISTLDDMVATAANTLNTAVKEFSGVNVANSVRDGYGWLRENIGQIPSTGAMWLQQLDDLVLNPLTLANSAQKTSINQVLRTVINQYRYDDHALQQRMQSLTNYLFQGTQDSQFATFLNEAATLLSSDGQDLGEVCAQFILGAPLYQSEHLSSEHRAILSLQLAREINDLKEITGDVLSQATSTGEQLISRHIIEQYYLPVLRMQDGTARIYVSDGLTALQTQCLTAPETLEQNVSLLLSYFNEGTLTLDTATALDQLAMALVDQGHDYVDVMTTLTMNNQYYNRFQYNPELSTSFETHLRDQMQAVQATSAANRATKLNEVLVNERQYSIDQYAQTLKPGQEVANDYKNILDQSHIRYSADGLSEYAAQILVFNNPVFFHDLTQQQKLALQNSFRAFFNEVQQSDSKMNEQAVVKNYNRLKTFIICEPYIDLIMSEMPVAGNIPSLFLQLDPFEVRAAVATHEIATMLEKADGYAALSLEQTVTLFRKYYDQQFASSSSKVEQGMRDIANETLRKQAEDPTNPLAILGNKTLDEVSDYVANSSLQIAQNRWEGTQNAYARPVEYKKQGHTQRMLHSFEKTIREDSKKSARQEVSNSRLGFVGNNQQLTPAYLHVGVGAAVPLRNPFASQTMTFSLPTKMEAAAILKPVTHIEEKLPQSALQERTPIFTPLLAANDIRYEQLDVPFWQAQGGFWGQFGRSLLTTAQDTQIATTTSPIKDTQKSAPTTSIKDTQKSKDIQERQAIVTDALTPTWSKGINLKLVPELPDSLSKVASNTPQPLMPLSEPSFGDKLLDVVIGKANANPLILVGMGAAGVGAAGAGIAAWAQNTVAGLEGNQDDLEDFDFNKSNIFITSFPLAVATQGSLGLFKKSGQNDKPRPNAPDPDKRYVQPPKVLPGFPEAEIVKGKTPYPGGLRKRWKLPDGKILEWDRQHGEVEIYDKNGKHLGAGDPNTGEIIKTAEKNRNIKKYL